MFISLSSHISGSRLAGTLLLGPGRRNTNGSRLYILALRLDVSFSDTIKVHFNFPWPRMVRFTRRRKLNPTSSSFVVTASYICHFSKRKVCGTFPLPEANVLNFVSKRIISVDCFDFVNLLHASFVDAGPPAVIDLIAEIPKVFIVLNVTLTLQHDGCLSYL